MGYGHILLVRNDAIQVVVPGNATRDELALEVGRAVLKVCLTPDRIPEDEGRMVRDRTAPVFNHANGIEWAGERHTSEEDVFVWAQNALMPVREWDSEVLRKVLDELEKVLSERTRGDSAAQSAEA